ncbi:hypothetical protein AMC83_PA00005 (plasmid) [Rhizobium phaseoli]|uniref:hypothetical protein n=1 Tax=Rhizobium phaseoli TaxID=396 RepID=UPI0007F07BE2|nr:hypothetical protein [Rhizobium phaseoli]ANL74232.1 hypothetical protein AMC83_PA00005 [Rhizobium phaseoli]
MRNLLKTTAKAVRKSIFGEEQTYDQVAVEYQPTKDDQISDILARVKAFNRIPLYQPTVEERKAEADTMRDLKAWMRKLSDNDRAIVAGRKPWEIMNHMLGIVPIDGVVAVGRGASYDFAPTHSNVPNYSETPKAANENLPTPTSSFQARALSHIAHELRQQSADQPSMQSETKMEPTYAYEPPRPSAAFMAAHGKFA